MRGYKKELVNLNHPHSNSNDESVPWSLVLLSIATKETSASWAALERFEGLAASAGRSPAKVTSIQI
jgi:hypothetical protein